MSSNDISSALEWDAESTLNRFIQEWNILNKCRHPGIVNLIGGVMPCEYEVWLVMEWIHGGDLHTVSIRDILLEQQYWDIEC